MRFQSCRPLTVLAPAALLAASLFAASGCSGGGTTAAPPAATTGTVVPGLSQQSLKSSNVSPSQSYQAAVAASQPLVYYPMNETSGTTAIDASGNAHNGTYVSNVTLNQPAIRVDDSTAKSVSFPSGYISENATWTQQSISAECWIRPTAADLAGAPRIIDNAWTDHDGKGFMMWISNGTIAFNTGWLAIVGNVPLVAGQAYHVVGTYDGTNGATLYLNGSPVANEHPGAIPNPQIGDSSTTYVGVLNATAGGFGMTGYFQGNISDCAVYNHAMTAEHINVHYNSGAAGHVKATQMPTFTPSPTPPAPTPTPTQIAYNSSTACIANKQYTNNVMPLGEGEFGTNGLDRTWWGRHRGNNIGGNQYSGFQTSWGRYQDDSYFGDVNDGISSPSDDPFYVGSDTAAPGAPNGVRISAVQMPAHLVGNPQVGGMHWYSGVLDTPVQQQYGFFVARVRVPAPAAGMSPAWWMLTNNGVPQGQHGPLNGEWDIQEMFGADEGNGMNGGNIVWNSGSSVPQNWGGVFAWPAPEQSTPSQNYHDYGVLISPGGAQISSNDYGPGGPGMTYGPSGAGATNFLDGVPLYGHTGGADMTQGVAWKEMMSMFQVAPAGSWLGNPNPANFPAYYWIQWIRAYAPTTTSC